MPDATPPTGADDDDASITGGEEDEVRIDGLGALEPDDPPQAGLVLEEVEAEPDALGTIRSGRLAGKSLGAAIVILTLPVLLQQAMQACVGLVDKMLAGRLPDAIVVPALDGIGIGSYVGWFVGIAMTGLGIGGQAIIARAMGAGRREESHGALGQAMALSVGWGALVGVALWAVAPLLGHAGGLSEDAMRHCVDYVRTLAVSMPFCGVMMVGAMCLHGAGETVRPSAIFVAVNVVNVALSYVLSGADVEIAGRTIDNPFGFDLHVVGIALGTAGSYVLGGALILLTLLRGVKDLRLELPEVLPIRGAMVRRIVRVGVPNFFEGLSMWTVNLFVLMVIGAIAASREGLQGAHIITVQWEAISFLPGFAIGTAAGALAGQYLGAGSPRMARKAVLVCTAIAIVVMQSLGVVFIVAGEGLTRIISDEPVHLEHVPRLLVICGLIQTFFAITMVVRQGLRGVGDTRWTFTITTFSSYAIRLPATWLLGVHLGLGLEGVWIGLCGEIVLRSVMFVARFAHGGWTRIRV